MLELLSGLVLLYWIFTLYSLRYRLPVFPSSSGNFEMTNEAGGLPPLVSIIVAAKEEEQSISDTIHHLLNQDYGRYEIIAVNDRSADQTGVKLEQLKKWSASAGKSKHVPLSVIHVTRLPQGWLGKNHALYQGYLHAKGQILLFTDADVIFKPNVLSEAVRFMRSQRADHLTLAPHMVSRSFWLRAFVHYFLFSLSLFTKPWLANDDRKKSHGVGIGAFNMVTRTAYEQIGTHKAFAMRPDDDLQLGARVKRVGLVQRFTSGKHLLQVEWYPDLPNAVKGLEKNFFSGFNYSIPKACAAIAGQLFIFLFPVIAIWFGGWGSVFAFAAAIAIMAFVYITMIRTISGDPAWDVLVLPFSVLLLVYVLLRSMVLTIMRGGIYWRGTFYPIGELKKMRSPRS